MMVVSELLHSWLFQVGKVCPVMKLKSMQKGHTFLVHLKLPVGREVSPEGKDKHKKLEGSRTCPKEPRSLLCCL